MLEKKMSASEAGLKPGLEKSEDLGESEAWVSSSEAMPEMTVNDTPTKHRHRKKNREIHNAVERHRKKKINSGINRIGELIPCSPTLKQSKNMILDQALKYITELKRQNDELLLNGGEKEQADEIIRLRKQLFDTQKENARYIDLLKSHDICLYDDPTIHWRGNLKNAKVPLTVPTNQVQKNIIVYSNGSPLGVNNQSVSFNVSQNLQKQTANVVPVQRTCNLLTPATIANVYTTENKTPVRTTMSASVSHPQIPLCLPVTIPAQAVLNIATSEGEPSILHSASTNIQDVFQSGMISQLPQVSSSVQQSNPVVVNSTTSQQHVGQAVKVVTQAASIPLGVPVLAQEPPSTCISCSSFQESSVVTVTNTTCGQSAQTTASGTLQSVNVKPIMGVLNSDSSLVTMTATVDTTVMSMLPSTTASTLCCLDSGWTLPSSLAFSGATSDLTKLCNQTRISTVGNTQTTWTTLQVAGNTVQPRTSHNALPILVGEQSSCTGAMPSIGGTQTKTAISLNNVHGEAQPVEPVTISLPQGEHVSVQPLVAQTQLKNQQTQNIVPLNAAMQVIQMTSPIGSGITSVPANQNVIILQPPNSVPCPPVMRAEVSTQAVGQQIVIIQAAPTPSPLPLLSAQAPGPSRMPVNPVCTNSAVQNTTPPQNFGGKHLVHILPRPTSSTLGSSASQTVSVAMSNQQQPATISLNGQLFALQPMMSSSSASNQAPMQFIQPTSSEDPNTNVALNTFGALASLSQSLSQMAGPSCVQLSVSRPTILPTASSSPVTTTNCISLSTTATSPITSEQLTALQSTSIAAKPFAGLISNAKCKKTCKKSSAKKRSVSNKDVTQVTKTEETAMLCPNTEASEPLLSIGEEARLERTSLVSTSTAICQADTVASVLHGFSHSNPESNEDNTTETSLGLHSEGELNKSTVPSPLLSKIVGEQLDLETAVCKGTVPIAEEAVRPQPPIPLTLDPCRQPAGIVKCSVSSECSKQSGTMSCLTSASTAEGVSSAHVSESSVDHAIPNTTCVSEMGSTSEPRISRQDSSSILQVASDLLEGQGLGGILLEIAKEKTSATTITSFVQNKLHHVSAAISKLEDSSDVTSSVRLMNTEIVCVHPDNADVSENEVVVTSSSVSNRQSDSPMSVSSGSNRNFSVASMLPDVAREELPNSMPLATALNISTSSVQTDVVTLVARSIIEQDKCEKGNIQVDENSVCCKAIKDTPLHGNGHHLSVQICKEKGRQQYETPIVKKNSHDLNPQTISIRPVEKPSCSMGIDTPNVSLQIATCQSQNGVSLSINNLIHPGGGAYPFSSCSSPSQASGQAAVNTTSNLPKPSVFYDNQSAAPIVTTEFSQEQHHAIRASTIQGSQVQEVEQKQNREARKEPVKRSVQEDQLLSTAKRQKLCESTPVQHDRISSMRGNSEDFVVQTQMLADLAPHNSSNSVVPLSSHIPTNSFNTLFATNVTFVNTDLRQTEIRCNSQPLLSDQQQGHNSHLQQRVSSQSNNHLHNSNPYLKQQQVGPLREHHLYQQHLVPHVEGSIHPQSHNVHQQRTVVQDVQMQKKRNLVQGSQANPLSLQQKHHGNDPGRQKGNQTHPHHHQPMQQQIQRHFSSAQGEKGCDNSSVSRGLHGSNPQSHLNPDILHQQQQEVGSRQQNSASSSEHVSAHNPIQRIMTSRTMEQHMVSQPSTVSRQSNMTCAPHRQERNRVSSYSAEALIGKTSNSEQRMAISIQGPRVPEQLEMRTYLDVSRNKSLPIHNMQSRITAEHAVSVDVQRLSDCQSYKPGGPSQQATGTFDIQTSRNGDMGNTVSSLRSMQPQTFRISQNSNVTLDRQKRLPYAPVQGIPIGGAVPPREMDSTCHQSFMQSLLGPHLGEPVVGSQRLISEHQRNTHCGISTPLEYGCPTGRESVHVRRDSEIQNRESCDMPMGVINSRNNSLTIPFSSSSSSGEVQGRNTSPHISVQKSNPMRITESQGSKSHLISNATSNVHGINRTSHPAVSHGNADQGQTSVRQSNLTAAHRSRNPLQDNGSSKIRQAERIRSSNPRHGNVFDPSLPHLPLASGSSMILGRQSSAAEKRPSIVRFMSDGSQVPNDNSTPDQHTLSQNFGFPFIPDGGMNPTINPNTAFIPPVTQSATTRTPALIPVDPQNSLPSFYPPYSPAHPSLSNDLSIPYFSNQMFTNPSTEKPTGASLNNRFGSILSPPRPVGFAQPSFPLLPDMPPMHMANPSHLSNFNLTSLFPEIATALPHDASAMSPLLSIVNSATSDSSKQSSNRPAHNISHILGHDCSSAV